MIFNVTLYASLQEILVDALTRRALSASLREMTMSTHACEH